MSQNIASTVEQLAIPILKEMHLELVDVDFKKEGKDWYLRIYIDSKDGVALNECSDVSEKLGQQLDTDDLIPQAYFLEVSSLGVERPLKKEKDFIQAIGKRVHLTTYEPIESEKTFEGELVNFDDQHVKMSILKKTKRQEVDIPFHKIATARLAVVFH